MWRDTNNRLGKKRKLCVEASGCEVRCTGGGSKQAEDDAQKSFFSMRASKYFTSIPREVQQKSQAM